MDGVSSLIVTLFNAVGLLALIAFGYGLIRRLALAPFPKELALGLLFACAVIATMLRPTVVVPGVIIDGRVAMVGLAGALGGPVPALMAAGAGAAFRAMIGGIGMPIGLVTIAVGLVAGLVWHGRLRAASEDRRVRELVMLGLVLCAQCPLILLHLVPSTPEFIVGFLAAMAASCIASTLVLGTMILREDNLIAREAALADFAYTDPLTGLANRRALAGHLDKAAGSDEGFGLMMIDIDHFKSVNDRFGHTFGDRVLKLVAERLRHAVRAEDVVARYGGEEFAVFMPGAGPHDLVEIAERARRAFADDPMRVGATRLRLTVSVGIALAAKGGDPSAIMRSADAALYRAKSLGRNRVEAASPPGEREDARPYRAAVPSPALAPTVSDLAR